MYTFYARSHNFEKRLLASSCLSVHVSAWNNSAPKRRIFMKFDMREYSSKKLSRKFKFHWNRTRITGTLHDEQYTYMIISRPVLLRMRNVSDKSCRENQNTQIWCDFDRASSLICGNKMPRPQSYNHTLQTGYLTRRPSYTLQKTYQEHPHTAPTTFDTPCNKPR